MAVVGSAEIIKRRAQRFQAAPAPMTAKKIMRDELLSAGMTEQQATEAVIAMVQRLATYEYHIGGDEQ